MQNSVEEKLAIVSSGKEQRKKICMEWCSAEVCLDFGSHAKPRWKKHNGGNGQAILPGRKQHEKVRTCVHQWGYSGLLCLWSVLREKHLQQLQVSRSHWSLEPQHNCPLQSVLAASPSPWQTGWADVWWLWWHSDFSGLSAVLFQLLSLWSPL